MELTIRGLKVDAGSGPGSRGGHIVGHTSGGKPIYSRQIKTVARGFHENFSNMKFKNRAELHDTIHNQASEGAWGGKVRDKFRSGDKEFVKHAQNAVHEKVKHNVEG